MKKVVLFVIIVMLVVALSTIPSVEGGLFNRARRHIDTSVRRSNNKREEEAKSVGRKMRFW